VGIAAVYAGKGEMTNIVSNHRVKPVAKYLFVLAAIMSMGILLPDVIAEEMAGGQLLRDDYVFAAADGRLVEGGPDRWLFEFESLRQDSGQAGTGDGGTGEVKAGQPLEMLRSATLEKMIEDAKERTDARYRLWGKATKFEGKNYVFAVYFVGLRKVDRPAGQSQQGGEVAKTTSINAPNDVLNIPDEIVSRLQTSEVLPAGETPAALQLKQDAIFANRAGRVVEKDGRYLFEPDGLGRGIEKFSIELLPCQKLEEAITQARGEPNPVRFSVAGILTRYKNQQYLLLQKVTRVYSYGNFGR
jgi:hypothetical protein